MFSNSLVITIYYDILAKLLIGPSSQFRVEKDESPPPFTFSDNSHFPSPHIFWRRGTASISFGNIRRKKEPVTTPPKLTNPAWHELVKRVGMVNFLVLLKRGRSDCLWNWGTPKAEAKPKSTDSRIRFSLCQESGSHGAPCKRRSTFKWNL